MRNSLAMIALIVIAPLCLSAQPEALPATRDAAAESPPHHIASTQMPGMSSPGRQTPNQSAPDLLREAASRPPMSLTAFEDLALTSSPTLKQAGQLVRRSAAQARQAGLYPNPSVGYEGSEIRGGSFGGGEQGAFIQQTVILGGKLGLRRRTFQDQQREDEAGVAEQRVRVLSDVDREFYSALAAQEIVKSRQMLLETALDASRTAHQLANVGQADEPDVLQAEVEADQARVEYATAQMRYIQAFNTLAATAGAPNLPVSPLEGNFHNWPKLDPQQIIQTILRDSPAVKRAQDAVVRAEAQLRSARREAIPDVQLRAGIQQDNEALNEEALKPRPVGIIGFASLGVSLPVFNRNQGNVAAAGAELERAREEVTRVRLSIRRSAEPLLRGYLAEELEANQYKSEIIPKAMRAYQLYLNKYREMAAAYPEVLVSQRTWFQLQVSYLKILAQLWQNAIALQRFTLTGGMDAPMPSAGSSTTINLPNIGADSSGSGAE